MSFLWHRLKGGVAQMQGLHFPLCGAYWSGGM